MPVYLWVVTAEGVSFRRLAVCAADIDRHCVALADALAKFDRPDDSWVQPAAWLYEHTIAPVSSELAGIERLIIVGDGKLCTVPFGVFVTARDAHLGRPIKHSLLIEDFTVAYAPSATVLATISQQPRPESWDYALWAFASTRFKEADSRRGDGPQPECGTGLPSTPSTGVGGLQPVPGAPVENRCHTEMKPYQLILRSARSMSLDDLPQAGREVEQVGRTISGFDQGPVKLFVDQPDMKAQLLSASEAGALQSVRFLHFATHATADPTRPYLSGLVLCPPYPVGSRAPSPSTPQNRERERPAQNRERERPADKVGHQVAKHSAGVPMVRTRRAGRPELMSVGELAGLNLGSDLLVLSACHSLGDTPIEGDWLYGLARAFLVAGSSGVVCTTTDTPDRGALSVVAALYHALLSDAEAEGGRGDVPFVLRRLKRAWLRSPAFAHPSVWGPWVYHGRPGTVPARKSSGGDQS